MLALARKVLGCLVRAWLCLLRTVCRKKQQVQNTFVKSGNGDDNWEAEGWGDFSVQVVPNSSDEAVAGAESEPANGQQAQEEDLFQDMKPVFRKPKKILLHSKSSEHQQINLSKFAVQDSVFRQEEAGELGVWSEDDSVEGWEGELAPDEGSLVQDSHETLKRKRAQEREKRRKAQEMLRTQQRAMNSSVRLGTRVS